MENMSKDAQVQTDPMPFLPPLSACLNPSHPWMPNGAQMFQFVPAPFMAQSPHQMDLNVMPWPMQPASGSYPYNFFPVMAPHHFPQPVLVPQQPLVKPKTRSKEFLSSNFTPRNVADKILCRAQWSLKRAMDIIAKDKSDDAPRIKFPSQAYVTLEHSETHVPQEQVVPTSKDESDRSLTQKKARPSDTIGSKNTNPVVPCVSNQTPTPPFSPSKRPAVQRQQSPKRRRLPSDPEDFVFPTHSQSKKRPVFTPGTSPTKEDDEGAQLLLMLAHGSESAPSA